MLWCNELAKGNTHGRMGAPYVLAGGAGGACGPDASCTTTARGCRTTTCCVSILNAMGVPERTFGKPEWCTGPLTGLL